jgi:hypothetical protein
MITYLSNEKNIILRWSIYRRFSKVLDIALKNQKLKNQLQLYGFHYHMHSVFAISHLSITQAMENVIYRTCCTGCFLKNAASRSSVFYCTTLISKKSNTVVKKTLQNCYFFFNINSYVKKASIFFFMETYFLFFSDREFFDSDFNDVVQ